MEKSDLELVANYRYINDKYRDVTKFYIEASALFEMFFHDILAYYYVGRIRKRQFLFIEEILSKLNFYRKFDLIIALVSNKHKTHYKKNKHLYSAIKSIYSKRSIIAHSYVPSDVINYHAPDKKKLAFRQSSKSQKTYSYIMFADYEKEKELQSDITICLFNLYKKMRKK